MRITYYLANYQSKRVISLTFLSIFVFNLLTPSMSYALTSGPSQPEVQSFEPVGTTEMVDLFSGDFTYNIPLFELPGPNGGYPFNLAYHAGIGMDQEASWVGLGWNLNPGAINRNMRGLPDDFKGDIIKRKLDMKPSTTIGVSAGKGLEFIGRTLNLNMGLGINYNNYKGFSTNLSTNLSFSQAITNPKTSKLRQVKIGLNGDFNSLDGPTISPSLSLTHNSSTAQQYEYGVSSGYNTRNGILSHHLNIGSRRITNVDCDYRLSNLQHSLGSASLSVAGNTYTPAAGNQMATTIINLKLAWGSSDPLGLFTNGQLKINFTDERLAYKGSEMSEPSYGYLYLGTGEEEKYKSSGSEKSTSLDFSREKDGVITTNSRYLASPSLSYDIFSVSGQGVSGMYRAFRSDIGTVGDALSVSSSGGASLGVELGAGATAVHNGADVHGNGNTATTRRWNNHPILKFKKENLVNSYEEPVYFKAYGESSLDELGELSNIGEDEPVYLFGNNLAYGNNNIGLPPTNNTLKTNRESKNTVIQPIYNKDIKQNTSQNTSIGEYVVGYYSALGTEENDLFDASNTFKQPSSLIDRTEASKENHIGGFTVTNTEGLRYIYALPAYNHTHVERQFSVDPLSKDKVENRVKIPVTGDGKDIDYKRPGTEKFHSRTEIPSYTHSHLLTSILGNDYLDVDGIAGPSDGDLGYWVKFTYEKKHDGFKWRAPFYGASYQKGLHNKLDDDKGHYAYGEKEIWYLKTAESKSHIAVFYTSERKDGHGAKQEIQNGILALNASAEEQKTIDETQPLYKLDKVSLYSKKEFLEQKSKAKPIVSANFLYAGYSYSSNSNTSPLSTLSSQTLCQRVENTKVSPNEVSSLSGKLTLEKVFFTYEKSIRGKLSPYIFSYGQEDTGASLDSDNPAYDGYAYDRWGSYKPYFTNPSQNLDFPYVNQFEDKNKLDAYASAWSLKEIKLPSGGTIKVNYETDDYGHVQDKTPMQMTAIAGIGKIGRFDITPRGDFNDDDLKIFFKLEKPVSNKAALKKYLPLEYTYGSLPRGNTTQTRSRKEAAQLYFKARINLKNKASTHWEMIAGYVDVDVDNSDGGYGLVNPDYAYVRLKPIQGAKGPLGTALGNQLTDYHPLSVAAWQHIQQHQRELIYKGPSFDEGFTLIGFGRALAAAFGPILEATKGYYNYMADRNNGTFVKAEKAWIRLNSPDKIKYGGGLRVKQIILEDNWQEGKSIYGQTYDYTTTETDPDDASKTRLISSGVATYEPLVGGDESPFRKAVKYNAKTVAANGLDYYFELPINEDLYPAPSVGYSKVTVKSLASAVKKNATPFSEEITNYFSTDKKFAATGEVCHEFYTAKDFPVISTASDIKMDKPSPISISLLLFSYHEDLLTATQGYVTELNDMHGKPKKVSYYAQEDTEKKSAVSSVSYNYKFKHKIVDGKEVKVLDNQVPTLTHDHDDNTKNMVMGGTTANNRKDKILGQEVEFFVDAREHTNVAFNAGVNFNTDMLTSLATFLAGMELSVGYSNQEVKTYVTNKIIHRIGILESVEAFDGSAVITTKNERWDAQTGEVILSSVNNTFEQKIFTYNIPAYFKYDRMGAAYRNIGLRIQASLTGNGKQFTTAVSEAVAKELVNGDEFIVGSGAAKLLLIGINAPNGGQQQLTFYLAKGSVSAGNVDLLLYRSGRRNLLSAKAGHITTLGIDPTDPTKRTATTPCLQQFGVPCD